ncbi:hypothetical protein HDV01_007865 [Terramyces sp. JEL0728]|nr:hypothetical protein HDV01_007865 [Terramyces sp. JEL0728]
MQKSIDFPLSTSYLLGICDYRANYLGCGQLTQHFATIDLVVILMTVFTIALYTGKIVQSLITKVLNESGDKRKWSPLDTTCLLCCLSNIFRIAQLVNARSIASKNTNEMTDESILKYVQVNIFMDFVYYGTGVAAATVFVGSVVGTATGVNLFSDLKFGDTTIHTAKVFAIFRMIVIILLMAIYISWATLGTSTTVENYTLFRRGGYLIALFASAFVTLPLLVYFSNNVISIMKEGLKIERSRGDLTKTAVKDTKQGTNTADQISLPQSVGASVVMGKSSNPIPSRVVKGWVKNELSLEQKIANFRFAISTVIWLLYVMTFCNLILLIVGFEVPLFRSGHLAILVLKSASDFSVWISCSFMLLYLYLC